MQSPHRDAALPWHDAPPASVQPGLRSSWHFVPYLHASAGHRTSAAEQAWQARPSLGTRVAGACCGPVPRSRRVAFNGFTAHACGRGLRSGEVGTRVDGYIMVPAQSALLEAYGGGVLAAAAQQPWQTMYVPCLKAPLLRKRPWMPFPRARRPPQG